MVDGGSVSDVAKVGDDGSNAPRFRSPRPFGLASKNGAAAIARADNDLRRFSAAADRVLTAAAETRPLQGAVERSVRRAERRAPSTRNSLCPSRIRPGAVFDREGG